MIEWSRVRELKAEIGKDGFDEIVELFLEEVEGVIQKLKNDVSGQLEQDLHFLKGSALNLGFNNFAALCLTGEQLSAKGSADQVDVQSILDSYEASKIYFLEGLQANT